MGAAEKSPGFLGAARKKMSSDRRGSNASKASKKGENDGLLSNLRGNKGESKHLATEEAIPPTKGIMDLPGSSKNPQKRVTQFTGRSPGVQPEPPAEEKSERSPRRERRRRRYRKRTRFRRRRRSRRPESPSSSSSTDSSSEHSDRVRRRTPRVKLKTVVKIPFLILILLAAYCCYQYQKAKA